MKLECLQEIVKEARALGIRCELDNMGLIAYVRIESKCTNLINLIIEDEERWAWDFLITSNCSAKDQVIEHLRHMRRSANSLLVTKMYSEPFMQGTMTGRV